VPLSAADIEDRSRRAVEVPLLRFLGASLVDGDGPAWLLGLTLTPNVLNAVDALHGGAIATVLEVAAYLAVLPHLEQDEEAITHGFSASYLAPVPSGSDLCAAGSLLRRTRRLAFLSAGLHSGWSLSPT
jgi:uncharacterized protein (TIGR00369 family)